MGRRWHARTTLTETYKRHNSRSNARSDHAVLAVTDSGVGIPEAELPRLFDRFHRVKGAKSRTHEGTGIGLAMVRRIIDRHGGRTWAEGATDQGATFYFSLPKKEHLFASVKE